MGALGVGPQHHPDLNSRSSQTSILSLDYIAASQGEGYMGPSFRPVSEDPMEPPLIQSIPETAAQSSGFGGSGGNGGSGGRGRIPRLELPVRGRTLTTSVMHRDTGSERV